MRTLTAIDIAESAAGRVAAWWWSPAGRLVACALVFAVVMTGLAILVVGMAGIVGRL